MTIHDEEENLKELGELVSGAVQEALGLGYVVHSLYRRGLAGSDIHMYEVTKAGEEHKALNFFERGSWVARPVRDVTITHVGHAGEYFEFFISYAEGAKGRARSLAEVLYSKENVHSVTLQAA